MCHWLPHSAARGRAPTIDDDDDDDDDGPRVCHSLPHSAARGRVRLLARRPAPALAATLPRAHIGLTLRMRCYPMLCRAQAAARPNAALRSTVPSLA